MCAVWYATWSPLTAAPCLLSCYVQPYFNSPSFCVTEKSCCADGVRFLHPFTMRTNARSVCLSMPRPKAGPHWVLKKAYRREWIGKQRGMWRVRNRKGSEFQWFLGFWSIFTASFTKAVNTQGLTVTGSNLCVNAWHKSVRWCSSPVALPYLVSSAVCYQTAPLS